jgi:hypothetical protein
MAPPGSPTRQRQTGLRIVNLEHVDGADTLDPADALAAFHSEAELPHDEPVAAPRASLPSAASRMAAVSLPPASAPYRSVSRWVVFLLAAVAIGEAPFVVLWTNGQTPVTDNTGTVYVETEPAGAEVWVNGRTRGRTPTRLSIPRGEAAIELRHAGSVRVVPLTIVSEEVVRLRVDLPAPPQESTALTGADDIPADAVGAALDTTVERGSPAPAEVSASAVLVAPLVQ